MAEANVDKLGYAEDEEGQEAAVRREVVSIRRFCRVVSTKHYRLVPELTFAAGGSLQWLKKKKTAAGSPGMVGTAARQPGGGETAAENTWVASASARKPG